MARALQAPECLRQAILILLLVFVLYSAFSNLALADATSQGATGGTSQTKEPRSTSSATNTGVEATGQPPQPTPTNSPVAPAPSRAATTPPPPEESGTERTGRRPNEDEYNFGSNSLGKAGEKVVTAIPTCGDSREQCAGVARSLDSMETISNISDYASYAAVAGTIGPTLFLDSNQKKDMETAATIQSVSGYANIGAGAVDIALGLKARSGEAATLESIRKRQNALCGVEQVPGSDRVTRRDMGYALDSPEAIQCQKFHNGRELNAAVKEIKGAANMHFIVGGMKALAGAGALLLANQSEKAAKNLESVQQAEAANQAAVQANQTLLSPTATPPTIGYAPTDVSTTPTDSNISTVPRTVSGTGASLSPYSGVGATGARRGGFSESTGGGRGTGGGPVGGALANKGGGGSDEDNESNSEEAAAASENNNTDWAGGGGSLNGGSGMDLGSGDGGFASLLGQMAGLGGPANGEGNGGPAPENVVRAPAESARTATPGEAQEGNTPNTNLFERVRLAIGRQVEAGNVVTTSPGINKI